MFLGGTLTFAGLLLSIMGYNARFMVIAGVTAITLALVIRWRAGDQPERDERSWKIWAFSITYSWLVTISFLAILLGGGYLGFLIIPAQKALEMVAWVMTISAVIFLTYFKRKGDVGLT